MSNKITWRKWHDPIRQVVKQYRDKQKDEQEENGGVSTYQEDYGPMPPNGYTGPCVFGPMGIVPIHEANSPSALYNFWMGHANFGITHEVHDIIAEIPGVESLDVYSRYRFRISIGKAWDTDDDQIGVRRAIDQALKANDHAEIPPPLVVDTLTHKPTDQMQRLRRKLRKKHPFWAICKTDIGQINVAGGKTAEEVELKLERLQTPSCEVVRSWESK